MVGDDEYFGLYELDSLDEWINTGYDEEGNTAVCDICSGEMRWSRNNNSWICRDCGRELSRSEWFNHIGANPPSSVCITNCLENYPFCKKICDRFLFDPDDPIMT